MSLRNKKSSLSLSRQTTLSVVDSRSVMSDNQSQTHKESNKIEKRLKRMSLFFQPRSRTEETYVRDTGPQKNNNNSTNYLMLEDGGEVPFPSAVSSHVTPSIYSSRNNSSSTLARPSLDLTTMGTRNINNVEFSNVRMNAELHSSLDSLEQQGPNSAKSKDGKFGRFLSKTGHKVKKFSDMTNDTYNTGLGLQLPNKGNASNHGVVDNINVTTMNNHNNILLNGNANSGNHGWSNILHPHQANEKDLKSPVTKSFPKSVDKMGLGEKLKLLNSTKYKSSNYHNPLRQKKEKGIKLGSKVNELVVAAAADNYRVAGTSAALNDFNYEDVDIMCNNSTLSHDQCEQYCNFLNSRIQQLLVPLFKGEGLCLPMEDLTKLISMYVRIRKNQERLTKSHSKEFKKYGSYSNVNDCSTILENDSIEESSNLRHAASQNSLRSLNADEFQPFETPYMKSNGFNNYSPISLDMGSPSVLSPMMNIRGVANTAMVKTVDEMKEMLKINLNIFVNQLYYDKNTDRIKYIKGTSELLSKRKNTLNSSLNLKIEEEGFEIFNTSFDDLSCSLTEGNFTNSTSLIFPPDLRHTKSNKTLMNIPIAKVSESRTSGNSGGLEDSGTYNTSTNFESLSDNYDFTKDNNDYLKIGINQARINQSMLDLGVLPVGRFERCINLLWDIFQRNVMYELLSVMLPLELEFANGHRDASQKHNVAAAILYNKGEKLETFTNTTIHPDISGTLPEDHVISHTTVGTLGEWTDVNIRSLVLIAFRDNVVIPLYEMNRKFEDVRVTTVEEYIDVQGAVECFKVLATVLTGDTNQKLVENLRAKFQDALGRNKALAPVN